MPRSPIRGQSSHPSSNKGEADGHRGVGVSPCPSPPWPSPQRRRRRREHRSSGYGGARHGRLRRRPRPPKRRPPKHRPPEAPAAAAFQVPTDNCPPEATTALADGEPIKLAFIGSRPAWPAFGVIAQGMNVLRQANGRQSRASQVEVITKDDACTTRPSPPGRPGSHRGDQVLRRLPDRRTSLAPPATCRRLRPAGAGRHGLPQLGRSRQLPRRGIPSYTVEANVWTEFIKEKFPDATKVALLTFNNDFGKTYGEALNELLGGRPEIVADVAHEPTARPVQRGRSCWRRAGHHHRRHHVDVHRLMTGPPGRVHRPDHQLVHLPGHRAVHGPGR